MGRRRTAPVKPRALERYAGATWSGSHWIDGGFWYDEAAADAAVRFFSDHLVLTEGEWAGRPFILEDWQDHDIVRPLFGWKREDGTRRFRRCFVWIPRKNGKTELAAGVSLLMLLGDAEPGAQVFAIASEKDQARLVFDKAAVMVSRSASLTADLEALKETIYCPSLNASFRPLSGKPQGKHGLNMSGLVGDEIHEWKSGDLYVFVHDSSAARRQPLEFLISTGGVKGTYGEDVWDECQAILKGDIDDPETLVVIYGATDEDDWKDPAVHRKANPNWGKSVKVEQFTADFRRALQVPRYEAFFRRYRLNQWTDQATRWLPIDSVDDDGVRFGWDHCKGPLDWTQMEAPLVGRRCFGGLDLSSTTDLSALAWYFPPNGEGERPKLIVRCWKPFATLKDHAKRDKLPYERWRDEGALFVTNGNVIDYAAIRRQVMEDAERFDVCRFDDRTRREAGQGGLAIDRWNATETAVELENQGLQVVMFGQGFASMSAPAKELERLVMGNDLEHGGHPVLRQHAKVVAVEQDAADNIKPSKSGSSSRIDLIVAGVMAIGVAAHDPGPAVKSFWES